MTIRDARPPIATLNSGGELKRWYWRKDELVAHARNLGLKTTASKFMLLDRIAHFLDSGEPDLPGMPKSKIQSKFDWHSEALDDETRITDSYKNNQNVRRYFKSRLGDGFKFNIAYMEWMKANVGSSLKEACVAYQTMKSAVAPTRIKDNNQFNQYTRDFLNAHPDLGPGDVRRVWAWKTQQPPEDGRHRFDPSDLEASKGGA